MHGARGDSPPEGSVGRCGVRPTAGGFSRFQVTPRREQAEGTEGKGQVGNYCMSKTTLEGLPDPCAHQSDSGLSSPTSGSWQCSQGTWLWGPGQQRLHCLVPERPPPPPRACASPGQPGAPATWWPERALQRAEADTAEPSMLEAGFTLGLNLRKK